MKIAEGEKGKAISSVFEIAEDELSYGQNLR